MFDFSHPWYQPLGRRIGVVVVCAFWFGMELWMQSPFWYILTGALTVFTGWRLLLAWPPKPKE